jgi:hypothetical protein
MRMSASRIRSINRAIARVQSTAWTSPRQNSHQSTDGPTVPTGLLTAGTVKAVAVPRAGA